jgi:hypothetical protein
MIEFDLTPDVDAEGAIFRGHLERGGEAIIRVPRHIA